MGELLFYALREKVKKVLTVIPSRLRSTRLPRKPLLKLNGKPMIQHVYEGALQSKLTDKLIIATDSKEIANCIKRFGGKFMLTSKKHKTGTDRVAEAAKKFPSHEIVLNIQGDSPLVTGQIVDAIAKPLIKNPALQMTTLKSKIIDKQDLKNPSIVKLVTDKNNFALYFSRSPIPYNIKNRKVIYYRHRGLYGFRRSFLLKYTKMPQSFLEKAESLEQLRVLENGIKIFTIETNVEAVDVNVREDIKIAENLLKGRG